MKEEDRAALVPSLRFPEFREAAGWEERAIGDSVDLLSGYPFDGPDISPDNKGIRLLRGINITEGSIRHSTEIDRYYLGSKDGLEKFEVRTNDLVIGMDGSKVGKNSALVTENDAGALLIQRVARLRTDDQTMIRFIFLHINSPLFHRYVDRINTSSGIPHISSKQIRDFAIYVPLSAEQQKITECLGSLDELIAAQARKVGTLKTYKKGLMKQLFPREGETQPRLRFPEFIHDDEWGEDKLGNLVDIKSGESPSKYSLGSQGKYAFVKVEDLNNCTKYQRSSREYSDDSDGIVQRHSILFPKRGAAIELNKIRITASEMLIDTNLMALTPNDTATVEFLHYYLVNVGLAQIADTSTIPQINNKHIIPYKVQIPSKSEQKKIGNCLSSLDDLLAFQTQKLDALKTHKKGLMQQLFPSRDEVEA